MAHVEKYAGGRWRARWRDPSGRTQSKVFDRKVDADRHLTAMESNKLSGAYVDPRAGRVSFREYAERWQDNRRHLRRSTTDKVGRQLALHVLPLLGDRAMADVRPSHVQSVVSAASLAGLSPRSVEGVHRTMSSIFTAAVADRIIATSPCRRISLPRPAVGKVDPLSVEEVDLLAEASPDRYRALIVLGAGCGLRLGEALGLTVDRVDFLRRTLTVDRQLVRGETTAPVFGPPKTDASVRTIPAPQVVLDALAAHLAAYGSGPDGLVFTNRDGRAIRADALQRLMQRTAAKAGVEATFHDLRHHCASLLIDRGVSVRGVQTFLGHASASVTLDTYSHLWHDSDDRIREAIDGAHGVTAQNLGSQAGHGSGGSTEIANETGLSAVK
jgi:integrase